MICHGADLNCCISEMLSSGAASVIICLGLIVLSQLNVAFMTQAETATTVTYLGLIKLCSVFSLNVNTVIEISP